MHIIYIISEKNKQRCRNYAVVVVVVVLFYPSADGTGEVVVHVVARARD